MEQRQEKIAALEADAAKLVEELGQLKSEVTSYKTATEELWKARAALAHLTDQTESLVTGTHNLIQKIEEIGASKLQATLESCVERIEKNTKATATNRIVIFVAGGVALAIAAVSLFL